MRIQLTQDVISKATVPKGRRKIEYVDTQTANLMLEVRSTGTATYRFRAKGPDGRLINKRIGRATDMKLADARREANLLRAQLTMGQLRDGRARPAREAMTFATFFEEHYLPHVKSRLRSARNLEAMYRSRLKEAFGSRALTDIRRQEIQAFHTALKDEGLAPATADHVLKLIRQAYNMAISWDIVERNPAARVPLFNHDNRQERYMSDGELSRLLEVLHNYPNRNVATMALWLLATGARLGEALQAQWKNIDEDERVWVIPAARSKSKKIRSVPLNDTALQVLGELTTRDKHEHLWVTNKGEPYRHVHKVWDRIRKKADLPHLRIHDLRHQTASLMISAGRTLYEVQQVLGHSSPIVTQRYAHLSTKALQEAAATASDKLKSLMGDRA